MGRGSEVENSLKREVDEMDDLKSPGGGGGHWSPKQAVGIRSSPEADWVWGYGGGGQPRHPEQRDVGQQG